MRSLLWPVILRFVSPCTVCLSLPILLTFVLAINERREQRARETVNYNLFEALRNNSARICQDIDTKIAQSFKTLADEGEEEAGCAFCRPDQFDRIVKAAQNPPHETPGTLSHLNNHLNWIIGPLKLDEDAPDEVDEQDIMEEDTPADPEVCLPIHRKGKQREL